MLAKEADRWAGEEERGGGVGWRDKTGGVGFFQDGGEDRILLVMGGGKARREEKQCWLVEAE